LYETWSLTLKGRTKIVFENRVLRIFEYKREKMVEGRAILHNEELRNHYASPSITWVIMSRRMRCVGHVAPVGEMRNAYYILVGKPAGKRQLGRPRCRWEDIRMDLREREWEGVDWKHIAEDRDQ
jgi:hypothetical protein